MSPLSVTEHQILRLAGAGPRYTSYPTAPVWSEEIGPREARAAHERAGAQQDALALYVHLPFCRELCLFCGCTVEITRREDRVARYLDALEREIALVADALGPRRRIVQMHWGGGTPTHLSSQQLARLHAAIASEFSFADDAEISLELHPHVTSLEQLDTLISLGFNRLSMGVQDTDEEVQSIVRRHQTLEETTALVRHARSRGVASINLDLMYGLPAQTEHTFAETLEHVTELLPERLAVYGYAHIPWLKPAQNGFPAERLPDPVLRARLFAMAVEHLGCSGYEVIGLDHFALPTDTMASALRNGSLQRNFMGYTTQRADDMLALGMSAIGDVGGLFLQNARDTASYEAALMKGEWATFRGWTRTEDDRVRGAIIQSIMCRTTLDLAEIEREAASTGLAERFAPEWQRLRQLEREGLCELGNGTLEVTPLGRLFLRHLAMVFDAYLEPASAARPRFSQTV